MKGPRPVNPLPGLRLRRLVSHGQSVQIAKALGLSPQTLSQYLTGKRNIPNEVLVLLAQRFNISTDDLLAADGDSSLDLVTPQVTVPGPPPPNRGSRLGISARAIGGPLASDAPQAARTMHLELGGVAVTVIVELAAAKPP